MPRISPRLVQEAFRRHPLLPLVLQECRDLRSAQNELRWLAEHANAVKHSFEAPVTTEPYFKLAQPTLIDNVRRRSRGEPLQYILGTQPFGALEILCRKGVLIPRPETETYTTKVAEHAITILERKVRSSSGKQSLRVLDLCTGTGCIPLLLCSLTHRCLQASTAPKDVILEYLGIDISPIALKLAHENLKHNIAEGYLHASARDEVSFQHGDVFAHGQLASPTSHSSPSTPESVLNIKWDIVLSNPPYISPTAFAPGGSTSRSVRKYEPKLALVPDPSSSSSHQPFQVEEGDTFYPSLLHISTRLQPTLTVLEVGGDEQAERVVRMIRTMDERVGGCSKIEVWRDDGEVEDWTCRDAGNEERGRNGNSKASVRAVVLWR